MTTANAHRMPRERGGFVSRPREANVISAPGHGREALTLQLNAREISLANTQGHSVESKALKVVLRDLAESVELRHHLAQGDDGGSYNHVPLTHVRSVKATYKLIGKMPPRQLPESE